MLSTDSFKAWENRLFSPFDLNTERHYDDMGSALADLLDGVTDPDRGDRRRLLAKAYRAVSASAELVHMFRATTVLPRPLIDNRQQNNS